MAFKKSKPTLYERAYNSEHKKKSKDRLRDPINIFQKRKDL